jgi:hypothetical protein
MDLALQMNKRFAITKEDNVIAAALCHDIAKSFGEKEHHTEGARILRESDIFNQLCLKYDLSKEMIIKAVEEHRASYKGQFSSKLSELISSADRGYPDLDIIVRRCILFYQGQGEATLDKVVYNVKRKYAGYAKYPTLYKTYFDRELLKFRRQCHSRLLIQRIWDKVHNIHR